MQSAPQPVTAAQLHSLTSALSHTTPDPQTGIFGPGSASWRVNRESALFLAAGRASLLQLAHPWVAAALHQHSNLRSNPLARFHHTFRIVFAMVFGTLQQALEASRYLYRLHSVVRGNLPRSVAGWPQGTPYQANERNALIWVFATLVDSAVVAHDAVLPPLTPAERQTYYNESKLLATLFGVPQEILPADWPAFQNYIRQMIHSTQLGVDPLARELAHGVLRGSGTWIPVPRWYRDLTALWLPQPLRDSFALPFQPSRQSSAEQALRRIRNLYPHTPAPIRFVGPYREARSRLAGHPPGPLIRLSNRFWTGSTLIPFHPEIQ